MILAKELYNNLYSGSEMTFTLVLKRRF